MRRLSVYNLFLSFLSLMIFWLIMSGKTDDPLYISFGVLSVVITMAFNHKLKNHHFFENEMDNLSELRFAKAITYVFWILKEILLAGFHVASVIIDPRKRVETYILKFRVDLPSANAKMILGNSITLTPGTLTIDIVGDEFTVHALTPASYKSITSDTMPKRVLGLFEKTDRPVIKDVRLISNEKDL